MTAKPAVIAIASDRLRATISPLGAELQSLATADGDEWLWDGDPAWWTGRAPILFPVVGTVAGGVIRVDGAAYPMAKHGIARHRTFDLVANDAASATLRLAADAETRASYPFEFALDLQYAVSGATLTITAVIENRDSRALPASFGFHPAFRWPLPEAGARADHIVRFAEDEPAPIRRIDPSGLLTAAPHPSPVDGDTLHPQDAMFADDALIFDEARSRSLWFGVPGRPGVRLSYPDLPLLGIWTKPGAPYLCLEPWQGVSDPVGYAGAFADKPGTISIAQGGTRSFTLTIEVGAEERVSSI